MATSFEAESERSCIVLVVVERDGSLVLVVEPTRVAVLCSRAPPSPAGRVWQHVDLSATDHGQALMALRVAWRRCVVCVSCRALRAWSAMLG
jgi:hypothetical protein